MESWRFSEAIKRLNEASQLAQQNNEPHLLALAHENLAMNYSARADFPQALENYRKAFAIFEKEKNPHAMAYVYGNMGVTYERMGDIENAMTLYEKSLEIHKKGDYRFGQSIQIDNIAEAHSRLGHHEQAIEFSLKALELVGEEGPWVRIQFLQNLADRYLSMNNVEQAAFYATRAKRELTDQENTRLLLRNNILMARLELRRKAPTESLRWLNEARFLAKDMGNYYDLGICEGLKAQAHEQLKQPVEAASAYTTAISLHEKIYSYELVHNWYVGLAELHAKNGDHDAAVSNFEKSLSAIAAASDLIAMDRFRVDLFRENSRIYRSYASYLAQHGKHEEALRVLEEGRARDLRLRIAQARGMKDTSRKQTDLLGQIHRLQNQLSEGDLQPAAMATINSRLQKSGAEYERLRTSMPGSRHNQTGPGDPDTLYLEYALHENSLLVFSYHNGKTQFRAVKDAGKIGNMAARYLAGLSNRTKQPDRSLGNELFRNLLEPELKNRQGVNLIIVPDGFIHHLPFAALVDSKDRFLAEDYSITYAPSISLLSGIQRDGHSSSDRVLSVANTDFSGIKGIELPSLPLAPKEATDVAKYGDYSQVVIDETERKVRNTDFSAYGIVHFATHTLIDEDRPERSSIVFKPGDGDDGLFRATDIYKLRIPSNMVMLSSCRSGSGKAVPGEGLLGLSHAFFAAGVRSLVMTYWNVSDKTAHEFSGRFYGNLHGLAIAEALRKTQVEMIRSNKWNHPVHWAAFFVAGDSGQKLHIKRPWQKTLTTIIFLVIILSLVVIFRFRHESKGFKTAS